MSEKYEEYKTYYELGIWTERKLQNAVMKGKLTESEYKEITGSELNNG